MNKNDKAKSNGDNNNNKVQGFVFGINLEGDAQVVMEGIKAFTSAMSKSGTILTAPVARPVLPSAPAGKPKSSAAATVVDQTETPAEIAEEPTEVDQEEEVEGATRTSNGSGPKRDYTFKAPNFLHDLDLRTANVQLSEFVAEKAIPQRLWIGT